MTGSRASFALLGLAVAVGMLAACSPAPEADSPAASDPQTTSPGSPTPAPTGTAGSPPAPDYALPASDQGQLALAEVVDDGSSAPNVAGPEIVLPTTAVRVVGQCIGDSAGWELYTAAVDVERRVLLAGTLECDEPARVTQGAVTFPYEGPVQIVFIDAEDVSRAWIQAIVD